ncbi:unnamed protein product [Trifolium pratense]|uniref:Uncharacterized protein n=1 Tax=Trifolium pratense TaxID=57577 RepID=A0ACB0IKP9_TRIPR|nr:unnamed protein product [Trifolium pratense]
MVKIHKFIYTFVTFLSIIVLATSYRLKYCMTGNECPAILCSPPTISKCVRNTCYCTSQKRKKKVKK